MILKKTTIIILVAVVLAAILLAVLLIAAGRNNHRTDPDSRYAYSFSRSGKNVLITVKGDFPEGYSWKVGEGGAEVVSVTEKSAGARRAVFTVAPVGEGTAVVRLSLERENFLPDRIYEILVPVTVSADGQLNTAGGSHKEYAGLSAYGEGSDHPYYLVEETGGEVRVVITRVGEAQWAVTAEPSGIVRIRIDERVPDASGAQAESFTLSPISDGTSLIALCDTENSRALTIRVTVENGKLRLGEHSLCDYTYTEPEAPDHREEVEALIGKVTLPDGAVYAGSSLKTLTDGTGNGAEYAAARVSYTLGGIKWTYTVVVNGPKAALEYMYEVTAPEKTVLIGPYEGSGYTAANGTAFAAWTDAQGNSYALAAVANPDLPEQKATVDACAAEAVKMVDKNPAPAAQ